jgi:hypothetical protein
MTVQLKPSARQTTTAQAAVIFRTAARTSGGLCGPVPAATLRVTCRLASAWRRDRVDSDGKLILCVAGKLHHIGIGRTHARTSVLMLIQDLKSASSTPPPANSSANSSSTPPVTTSQPAKPKRPRTQ